MRYVRLVYISVQVIKHRRIVPQRGDLSTRVLISVTAMRFTPYLVLAPTAAVTFAQLFDPLHRTASDIQQQPQSQSVNHAQILLGKPAGELGPAMPPSGAPQADGPANAGGGSSVMLSDVMGRDKSINLFAG